MKKVQAGGESVPGGSPQRAILEAALVEFAERGFRGATIGRIAERAGVTPPAVHYHFENKEELWRAAISEVFARLQEAFDVGLEALRDAGPYAVMKGLLRTFVRFTAEHPELHRIIGHEGARDSARLRWAVERHVGPAYARVEKALAAGRSGGWAKPIAPVLTVFISVGMGAYLFAIPTLARLAYGIDASDPATVGAYSDAVVEIFFHGLAVNDDERFGGHAPDGRRNYDILENDQQKPMGARGRLRQEPGLRDDDAHRTLRPGRIVNPPVGTGKKRGARKARGSTRLNSSASSGQSK